MNLKDPKHVSVPAPKRYRQGWRTRVDYGYDDAGKRLRKCFYGKSKQECQRRANDFLHQLRHGYKPTSQRTFAELLEEWLAEKEREVASSTLRRYRQEFANVTPVIGGIRLNEIEPEDIKQLRTALENISPRSVVQGLGRTRQVFRYAQAMGYMTRNPADSAVVKGVPYRPDAARVWSREEVTAFLAAAEGLALYPLFRLSLETGLRPGEALACCWDALDGTRLEVKRTVDSPVSRPKIVDRVKTHYANRTLELSPALVELLQSQRDDERLMFPGRQRDGATPLNASYTRKQLHAYADRAGVPRIRPHDLRHTFASLYIEAMFRREQFDLVHFSRRIMGHANPSFTLDRYAHIIEPHVKRPTVSLAELLETG